jgi:hypothetical protein
MIPNLEKIIIQKKLIEEEIANLLCKLEILRERLCKLKKEEERVIYCLGCSEILPDRCYNNRKCDSCYNDDSSSSGSSYSD